MAPLTLKVTDYFNKMTAGFYDGVKFDAARQVVILDDNLVHTDDQRMLLACHMLEQAAANVQIIIFTCHPERYRKIGGVAEVVV